VDPKQTSAPNSNILYVLLSGGTYSAERPSGKDGAVKSALNRREFNGLCGALCSFVASSGALALDAATAVALNGTVQIVKFRDATVVPAIGQGSARIGQGRHPAAEEEEALRTGLSLGMTLIDTAGDYGEGRSEELIKRALSLGLDLVHVPFGGGGPAVAAVVAGHTPISFGSPQAAMQHVKEGTVRALAVTSKTRSQIFPDVPTMTEVGYPQIEGDSWVGILVPAGTPAEIIAVL